MVTSNASADSEAHMICCLLELDRMENIKNIDNNQQLRNLATSFNFIALSFECCFSYGIWCYRCFESLPIIAVITKLLKV